MAKSLRACGQLSQKQGGDQLDCSQEGAGKLVVVRCDSAEALEFAEEALDEVSFAAEGEVGGSLDDAIGPGWNDGGDTAFFQGAAQGIGVVGPVGEQGFRLDLIEQRLGLAEIGCLPGVSDMATALPSASTIT